MDEKAERKYILDMVGNFSDKAIDHARNPRNVGNIPQPDGFGQEEGECGDTMAIWLKIKGPRIVGATFWTDGCGSSIACGSVATELANSLKVEEALQIKPEDVLEALDGLPDDHAHCATLAANALRKALDNYLELSRFPWKSVYQ